MPTISASIDIAAPPEQAFAFVADPYRRRLLLPDNFRDFRVVSESDGAGTRTAFTIVTPQGEHPSDVEVQEWDPPRGLAERTLGEDGYVMRWRFETAEGGCRVSVRTEYSVRGGPLHRLVDRWFARKALESSLQVELSRLKHMLESESAADRDDEGSPPQR